MKVEQIYTGCLAHAAYYIENNGEVAIIDPLREVQPYINRAKLDDAKIKYVFETHFHADFVSGHLDLKEKTGASIVFGPTAKPNYEAIVAEDGQIFEVGNYKIKVIHTPGHTMESTTYLLIDENGKEHGIVTGDTLFIGDVGRPDLAQKVVEDLTQEKLAGYLYDSLRNKIMPLSDDLIVYPNHGAGSACGKNMSKETTDTLGNQKKVNYALRADMTKEEFIEEVLDGLSEPPGYFPQNVMMNITGYESFDNVITKSNKPLSPEAFEAAANETEAIILDVRHQSEFVKGHIPRSIFIGIDGGFAPWVGALIVDVSQPILLVAPEGREEEVVTRLSRVGFDNVIGYLDGSFQSWKNSGKEYDTITSISAEEFANRFEDNKDVVFDVRKNGEFTAEHVDGAKSTPLDYINNYLQEFPDNKTFYVHCAGGYRSVIAASILKSRGIHNLIDVGGGYGAIKKTDIPVTDYVCPSTLK
ncbi:MULTISPECIES: rhodanese-like domain-containing protein [Mesoflavibacter]|uniref:MBL fold metallo-hydrolase n=1 Tax=Mesoflavibacter zeaxanthinifaciens subsp. sabulilitoris TaxID=1520893 RepID=A0A2T1NF61_9FLAO|nr:MULTISPECIES: MBL fold metallo-hydrolase [Mesoflavibacter]MBB3124834.1 glyoxylase-like metal-dependent hydrolase (beta-lactamase superfamily II)/rhodanese-related sulfurtransferase [Mesoflavibacter zeaxanthinifaciens subsp. sabulilitoris]MCP4053093.1 MBL fold metallo-hydrolase [Mesoflavibacter sp.]PSG91075.1 MBL fold metallo-hydrolase [Mesoflavibacter zeaxanthinifaciens subsp. sabulilitoris]UAB74899.1 MBL fold metallo-hydrolase [Mesoflavibacter sp. SCSIO 43206]